MKIHVVNNDLMSSEDWWVEICPGIWIDDAGRVLLLDGDGRLFLIERG
ncbi:hypothetical protein [Desulfolithobacter sp.]